MCSVPKCSWTWIEEQFAFPLKSIKMFPRQHLSSPLIGANVHLHECDILSACHICAPLGIQMELRYQSSRKRNLKGDMLQHNNLFSNFTDSAYQITGCVSGYWYSCRTTRNHTHSSVWEVMPILEPQVAELHLHFCTCLVLTAAPGGKINFHAKCISVWQLLALTDFSC